MEDKGWDCSQSFVVAPGWRSGAWAASPRADAAVSAARRLLGGHVSDRRQKRREAELWDHFLKSDPVLTGWPPPEPTMAPSGPPGTIGATSEAECGRIKPRGRTQFLPSMISHPGTTEFSAPSWNKLSFQPCPFQWSFDFHLMPPLFLSHFSLALSRSLSRRWHYNITFKCQNLS